MPGGGRLHLEAVVVRWNFSLADGVLEVGGGHGEHIDSVRHQFSCRILVP